MRTSMSNKAAMTPSEAQTSKPRRQDAAAASIALDDVLARETPVAVAIFLPRFFDQENRAPLGEDGAWPWPYIDHIVVFDRATGDALNRVDPGRAQQLLDGDERL